MTCTTSAPVSLCQLFSGLARTQRRRFSTLPFSNSLASRASFVCLTISELIPDFPIIKIVSASTANPRRKARCLLTIKLLSLSSFSQFLSQFPQGNPRWLTASFLLLSILRGLISYQKNRVKPKPSSPRGACAIIPHRYPYHQLAAIWGKQQTALTNQAARSATCTLSNSPAAFNPFPGRLHFHPQRADHPNARQGRKPPAAVIRNSGSPSGTTGVSISVLLRGGPVSSTSGRSAGNHMDL